MNSINKGLVYYYTNLFIVVIFLIISYIYTGPNNKVQNMINMYNNNILEVEEVNNLKLKYSNTNSEDGLLKIYNNGKINLNYKLIYRIKETNIDTDKLRIFVNNNYYNYSDIINAENAEYTDLLIDMSSIDIGQTKDINISFIVDDNKKGLYIKGDYVIESINSKVVFK